jgi:hypothetical protein
MFDVLVAVDVPSCGFKDMNAESIRIIITIPTHYIKGCVA